MVRILTLAIQRSRLPPTFAGASVVRPRLKMSKGAMNDLQELVSASIK